MKLKSYTPFIILSSPRCGSNLLADLLRSNRHILVYPELFVNQDAPIYWERGSDVRFDPKYVLQLRDQHPLEFLERYIFGNKDPDIQAVGFKFFYEHASDYGWRCIWQYLRDKKVKVIHLKRADVLKSLVSMKMAQCSDKWTSIDGVAEPGTTVELHFGECVDYFDKIEAYWEQLPEYFRNNDIYTIEYQDLCMRQQDELVCIQKFLGVPIKPVTSRLMKQNPLPIQNYLCNYGELKKDFIRSKWEKFFQYDGEAT